MTDLPDDVAAYDQERFEERNEISEKGDDDLEDDDSADEVDDNETPPADE